jgi:hypothetical protein
LCLRRGDAEAVEDSCRRVDALLRRGLPNVGGFTDQ